MNRCDCLTLKLLTRLVRIRGKFDQGWFKLPVVLHQKKPVDVPLMLFTSRMVTKKRDRWRIAASLKAAVEPRKFKPK
jgi:hypothetical protein